MKVKPYSKNPITKVKPQSHSPAPLKHHDYLSSSYFYLRSSLREAKRRKLYFCLALTSTFIVVAATAVSQTVLDYAPLIFLRSAESKTGAIDVSISPLDVTFAQNDGLSTRTVTKYLTLNTTAIEPLVDAVYPDVMTARYTANSSYFKVLRGSGCNKNTATPYSGCPTYEISLVMQNTLKEKELGIGADLNWDTIPYGGIMITKDFASILQLSTGDSVIIKVDATSLLRDVAIQFNSKQASQTTMISAYSFSYSYAYLPFTVAGIVDNMNGKFPDGTDDSIVTEYQHFFTFLANNMPPNSPKTNVNYPAFVDYLKNENPQDYANSLYFNIKGRMDIYKNSNFDTIQDQLVTFASKISDAIGVFPFDIELPVFSQLNGLKFGALFLGIALTVIVVVLFILSTILIYNILLVTVETKAFEFGVIRMIGLSKVGIAQLILVQALLFVLPGVVLGLAVSSPLLVVVRNVLASLISIEIPIVPSGMALFWSIFMGIAIPIVSSYYPMKEALGKNLNLSLDLAHSKTNAVQISIETKDSKFPWPQVTFGILSVVFGVAIYIFLPLSLLSFNLGLLLGMFFAILMGLLIGLTILSLNFQHFMERLVTEIFLFWTSSSFKSLVKKNLVAHKLRNRQAATMYSLALGFIIFIMVSLDQQLNSMAYSAQANQGSLIVLQTSTAMDRELIEDVIQTYLQDYVEDYAFVSHDLGAYLQVYGAAQSLEILNKGQLYSFTPTIRAVSPSLFKTTQNQFLVVSKADTDTGLDLAEQLYTPRGSEGMIIGEAIRDQLELSIDMHSSALIQVYDGVNSKTEELRILASLDSAPGFMVSKYPSITSQDILISFPTYARLASELADGVGDVPINKVFIKAKDDSNYNIAVIVSVMQQIKQLQYPSLGIWDYRDTKSSVESNKTALSFIFKAVEVLVMILSMFSLVTSMSTNILEQTKEIAVLRAVGITKRKVNLLYVSEAFVLIVASAIFGIIIGTAVAYVLTIQSALFTELPVTFSFPVTDLGVILVLAIISAFLSSYFPANRVTKHNISKIIRLGS